MDQELTEALSGWYRQGHRDLPWRQTRDAYRIWVSEVMLQQTQVSTVIPYYTRFLEALPTVGDLARAPEDTVMKLWEGLGYYARCRNLHRAARQVVEVHGGVFPGSLEVARRLPGLGRSTAGAILTFAFGQRHPILDGNVVRVLSRLDDIAEEVDRSEIQRELWKRSESLVQAAADPSTFNQALMELGAVVCTPKAARCGDCPWAALCRARKAGTVGERPRKRPRRPLPHHSIGVGLIWRGEQVLIQLRPAKGLLGGLWEFPGGKQESGESLEETVAREIREELGIEVAVGKRLATIAHAYTHFRITLHAFHCHYLSGEPQPRASQDWRWVALDELERYAFPAANRAVLERLRGEKAALGAGEG